MLLKAGLVCVKLLYSGIYERGNLIFYCGVDGSYGVNGPEDAKLVSAGCCGYRIFGSPDHLATTGGLEISSLVYVDSDGPSRMEKDPMEGTPRGTRPT